MENSISVVINTYNASKYLAKVLETAKSFNEIVVCDMESTDNTVDIAKEYGAKVVTFPKENHKSAEPARTFAIQSAISSRIRETFADFTFHERTTQWAHSCPHHTQTTNCVSS